MKFSDYENYKKISAEDEQQNWQALQDLLPHLNDHLLLVDEYEFEQISPCRLITFTAKNSARTRLYALASDGGRIIVGKTDDLPITVSLDLTDFDPQHHEIVTLTISGQDYFLSQYLSLWVCVNRYGDADMTTVLYHARVGADESGKLHLAPAVDDVLQSQSLWMAQAYNALAPQFLKTWNFTAAFGLDPFTMPASINNFLSYNPPPMSSVCWIAHKLCYAINKQVCLVDTQRPGSKLALNTLTERASCLALKADEYNPSLQGIVGCKDYWLVYFVANEAVGIIECWRQKQQDHPVAISFVDNLSDSYELLILFSDGFIRKFHAVEPVALHTIWQQCWHNLGRADTQPLDDFLAASKPPNPDAYLYELLKRLFRAADTATPQLRQLWLNQISQDRLFNQGGNPDGLPKPCMNLLLQTLNAYANDEKNAWTLPDSSDLLPRLLKGLCDKQLAWDDQQLLFQHLRSLNWPEKTKADHAVQHLLRTAHASINAPLPDPATQAPDILLRNSNIALEYWANKFISSDTVLFSQHLDEQGLLGLLGLNYHETPYLLALKPKQIELYGLLPQHDRRQSLAVFAIPENTDTFTQITAVSGQDAQFVVLSQSGKVRVIQLLDPGADSPWHTIAELDCATTQALRCYSWKITTCPTPEGHCLLAVIGNLGRYATLLLYSLQPTGLAYHARHNLNIPRLSCVDLSLSDTAYLLFAATDQAVIAELYRLDLQFGQVKPERRFAMLRNGSLCVAFDNKHNPSYLLVGGYSGMLLCTALNTPHLNLCWSHQLEGYISQINTLSLAGQSYFLVSSGAGELCLLSADRGKRCWKERLNFAIYLQCFIPNSNNLLALALYRGRIKLFVPVSAQENQRARSHIDACIKHLQHIADQPMSDIPNASIYALHQIINKGVSAYDILKITQGKRVRSRILRYLAHSQLLNSHKDIIEALSFRELALSLSYTEHANLQWRLPVWREIKRRLDAPLNPCYTLNAAVVVCLQHLALEPKVSLDDLYEHRPPLIFLEGSIWVRLEYARLLAHIALGEKNPEQSLLTKLLPYLLKLSPRLVYRLQVLFSFDDDNFKDFKALDALLHFSNLIPEELLNQLNTLCASLKKHSPADNFAGLMLALASLHACGLENAQEAWRDWRKEAFAKLQHLIKALQAETELIPPLQQLRSLTALLNHGAILSDTDTIKRRLAWLELAKQSLDSVHPSIEIRTNNAWNSPIEQLSRRTETLIGVLLDKERKHLLQLVRPQLIAQCQRLAGNNIRLALTAQPEGHRQLQDVTLVFDAALEGGLSPPGHIRLICHYETYSSQNQPETMTLAGFVFPEQQTVAVKASLQDQSGYLAETLWHFPLPPLSTQYNQPFSLPTLLPKAYAEFKTHIQDTTAAVTWVVFDDELGAGQWLADWDRHYPQQRLDLDAATHDIGIGRKYSATPLDIARLNQYLKPHLSRAERLLLAPLDELLQRLLADNPDTLRAWFAQLQQHKQPPLVLLVSSLTACALRQARLNLANELCAHHLVLNSPKQAFKAELLAAVEAKTNGTGQAEAYCGQLGFDLRLISFWLQANKLAVALIEPQEFVLTTSITTLIAAELRALNPKELLAVLVGSRAVSQLKRQEVQAGLVAAESYYSKPRVHTPKVLQKLGTAFTEKSLEKLSSDQNTPAHLKVQGFGLLGTSTENSPLLKLCLLVNNARQLQELAKRGLGVWQDGVFRTRSPYREFILRCYQQDTGDRTSQDNRVYAALLGQQSLPIEIISTDDLLKFSNAELQDLMPLSLATDISKLRHLALLWQNRAIAIEVLLNPLKNLLARDTFTNMSPLNHKARWDTALLSLGFSCIGINKAIHADKTLYPETYLFWVDGYQPIYVDDIRLAIDDSLKKLTHWLNQNEYESYVPRIVFTGPGSVALATDPERRYARLTFQDALNAVWQGELLKGLLRKVQVQLRLSSLSPFKTSGALPPGSTVFRGRDDELDFLKARCRASSILIIGSRRVGKTSLLNQFYDWVHRQPDLIAIKADLQGIKTPSEFLEQLRHIDDPALSEDTRNCLKNLDKQDKTALPQLAKQLQQQGKHTLFLLNEVDGLAKHAPAFIEQWRSLNDAGAARFIMTGYAVIGDLGLPASAFFHFTEGTYYGGKAIALTALSEKSARDILDLLETSQLQLKWRSPEDKAQAYTLLLQRSYRIPWVLQAFGRLLVEQLEAQRQDLLTLADVEKLLASKGDVVWQYIETVRYEDFDLTAHKNAQRKGILVLLFALARHRYFLGGESAPIKDRRLSERQAQDLGFSAADIHTIVINTVAGLPIDYDEKTAWMRWMNQLDLLKTLRLLTLTLILEPDPFKSDQYAFLLHIFPLELARKYAQHDPMLNDLLMDTLSDFLRLSDR